MKPFFSPIELLNQCGENVKLINTKQRPDVNLRILNSLTKYHDFLYRSSTLWF